MTDGAGPVNRVRPLVDGFHNFLKAWEYQLTWANLLTRLRVGDAASSCCALNEVGENTNGLSVAKSALCLNT